MPITFWIPRAIYGLLLLSLVQLSLAQTSGNSVYSQRQRVTAEAAELSKRAISKDDHPPHKDGMFVDASVLMNVKADEYMACFGLNVEEASPAECTKKMDTQVQEFRRTLAALNIRSKDVSVDLIGLNRIYGFNLEGDVAKETLAGFELKKTISIHYKMANLLDNIIANASKLGIYDLIKVDYIISDLPAVQQKLIAAAFHVLKDKKMSYLQHMDLKLNPEGQIYAEKYSHYYPNEQYDSYVAFEGENLSESYYRQKYAIQSARKSRTAYFQPLDGKLFDKVINPIVLEPVVQCTVYLKVWFSKAQGITKRKPVKKK